MPTLNDPNDIGALIDALKAEQHRRTQERMDAGEQSTIVITGIPGEPRGPDNGGPITVVITGVPRAGDPDFEYDAPPSCPFSGPERDEPSPATSSSGQPLPPGEEAADVTGALPVTSAPIYIWTTIRMPTEDDPGEIAEGHYSIEGDDVVVTDTAGKPLGRHPLQEGEDPIRAARQILRGAAQERSFSAPIRYPRAGVA
jgi:hypothetical protein